MMRKSKRGRGFALCMALAMALTGCGSQTASTAAYDMEMAKEEALPNSVSAEYEAEAAYEESAEQGVGGEMPDISSETAQALQQRKLIRTVHMSVETRQFDQLLVDLKTQVTDLGGYIEGSDIYNNSSYNVWGEDAQLQNRSASLVLRIPSEKLDVFLEQVEGATNVLSRSDSVEDVTLSYVDLESHKKVLETEQKRLLTLLEQAESMEDIIALESRLSEVRYQLESMESQLRTYDNQVDYSTLYLDVQEVKRITENPGRQSTWERIREGFAGNVERVFAGTKEAAISFVIALPILFVWLVVLGILGGIFTVFWKLVTNHRKKKHIKQEKKDGK